jgi:type I site-specific restriction-modification system R (restriction) subunit
VGFGADDLHTVAELLLDATQAHGRVVTPRSEIVGVDDQPHRIHAPTVPQRHPVRPIREPRGGCLARVIISTVQKFPLILDEISSEHRGRRFAIIIDEAHSSQGGRTSAAISLALSQAGAEEDDETIEDTINRIMEAKKLLPNASYFAFTATPKNKTLEIFGEPFDEGGQIKHRPFHSYTMKQAIQEGFILDVLESYTPVDSYYKLVKKIEGDPEFDTKRAKKKLRHYVESHDHAIRLKAEIIVDHFHEQVIGLKMIGGQARGMVVTGGIERAIQYFHAIRDYLKERKSPFQAIVAFSGEHEYGGAKVTEASLNGFPSSRDRLDPILDACVAVYKEQLDEDGQVDFKGKAKAFLRTYGFLSSILPYTSREWETLSIFLTLLVPKLPAPEEKDLSKGILEAIDMDSYRVEKQAAMKIQLADQDAEIGPVPTSGGGHKPEPELDRLSNIIKSFNDQFGNVAFTDRDRVHRLITQDIPAKVAADAAYQNAKQNSDRQNARIEHDRALARVMTDVLRDDTELFKLFSDNDSFRRWLTERVFTLTYGEDISAPSARSD